MTSPGPAPESDKAPQQPPEGQHRDHNPDHNPGEAGEPPRRWVWMDRWDPGTWEMPTNPTKTQRVMAGLALVIMLVMMVFVPLKILGFF